MTEIIFNPRTGEFENRNTHGGAGHGGRHAGKGFLKRVFGGLHRAVCFFFSAIGKFCWLVWKVFVFLIKLAIILLILAAGYWAYSRYVGHADWESMRFWQQDRHLSMSGTVSRYPVQMELDMDGQKVTGYYYYKSQGSDRRLRLEGTADDGHLLLEETDEAGRKTGHFDGVLNDGSFSGQFEGLKKKKMNFNIKQDHQ